MAKKYLPFPIDLSEYPIVSELTALQYGLLRRILDGSWKNGEDLPKNEFILYHRLKCTHVQWTKARGKVYEALNIIMPDINRERLKSLNARLNRKNSALRNIALIHERRRGKITTFSDEKTGHMVVTPVASPNEPYKKDWFDASDRKKALKNKDNDDGSTFTD